MGDYWIKQRFSSIAPLFKIGTSLKRKNLLPKEAISFLFEQFIRVWKITFTTSGYLSWMLLFLLRTCVGCVMGATPISYRWVKLRYSTSSYYSFLDLGEPTRLRWDTTDCIISSVHIISFFAFSLGVIYGVAKTTINATRKRHMKIRNNATQKDEITPHEKTK